MRARGCVREEVMKKEDQTTLIRHGDHARLRSIRLKENNKEKRNKKYT